MARITDAKCKMCRREGAKLYLKGDKCFGSKCPLSRRPFAPGQHGPTSRTRLTPYGIQLREKQKAKRTYGILERQFRNYFLKAVRRQGDTGVFMKQYLELRLDNVVYRLGFAKSRVQARQLVGHGHFNVNGRPVNIPSYELKPGEIITIKDTKLAKGPFKDIKDRLTKHEAPGWLSLDVANLTGKIINRPEASELEQSFDAKLIVEFYSR